MNNQVMITRRERFSAAHKLWVDAWDAETNRQTFGGCANPNWHGHNYELFVSVKGPVNPQTGFVVNLKDLSQIIKTKIIQKLDHKNLNLDVNFLQNKMTTTEQLTISIWQEIEPEVNKLGVNLHSVKIKETENNFAEYFG